MQTCPICGAESSLEAVAGSVSVDVRGEAFEVRQSELHCRVCKETLPGDTDSLDEAYRAYRAKRGWKQPDEIRTWRERLGLTQKEMSRLLGWGLATLSRYETGALQTDSHETALASIMRPAGLRALLDVKGAVLGDERLATVRSTLNQMEAKSETLVDVFQRRFGFYPADMLSGFRSLDLQRVFGLLAAMCDGGERKTKLNKLCFYADFLGFARLGSSLTGLRYARLPLGPVPNKYEFYLAELETEGFLALELLKTGSYEAEVYKAVKPYGGIGFSSEEWDIIRGVKARFRGWTSSRIVGFSHEEKGWQETLPGAMISYKFAESLKIPD